MKGFDDRFRERLVECVEQAVKRTEMVHRLRHVVAADDIAGVGNERSRREQAFRMAARELAALDVVAVVGEFRL